MTADETRIRISGWRYPPWRGVFYPSGLPQYRELEYASGRFPTMEINGTFYSLQRPESFERWYNDTPPGFVFSIKGARYITHIKRLRDVDGSLANFFSPAPAPESILQRLAKLSPEPRLEQYSPPRTLSPVWFFQP